MKKSIIILILLCILTPSTSLGKEVLYDQYQTDLGFTINSYSENWTGHKLVEVYDELKKNTYGEEINYLKEINLYSNNPNGGKEEGVYNATYKQINILGTEKIILSKNNSIDLYNLENKDKVEEFAKTLSHEYGHHFTLYYLIDFEEKTFDQWEVTKLYDARELTKYKKITNDYENGHEWSIIEICAEDYVQLYGSPSAKMVNYFDDIEGRYISGTINKSTSYSYSIFNLNPQENAKIPLALEMPELKKYWEEASGLPSRVTATTKPSLALVDVINLGFDKIQYKFQWNKSIGLDGQEAKYYTLVATDLDGNEIIPIKTVERGGNLEAVVGSIRVSQENNIMFYTDSFIESQKVFKVYAISSTDGVISSELLKVDFDNPKVTKLKTESNITLPNETDEVDEKKVEFDKEGNKYIDKVLDFIFSIIEKITSY